MMMPIGQLGPWFTRLMMVMFIFAAASAAPALAFWLVIASAIAAVAVYLHQARYLPAVVLNRLDRLTGRAAPEDARTRQLVTIDAGELPPGPQGRAHGRGA